jgi:ParB family chromosome partitioning protein
MQMSKEVHTLKLDDILPNRFQPRIVFDEVAINELTESIKQYGVIEPIIVRKVADKYEIIAGERRYKASVLAGKDTIPAIVTDLNDKDSAEIALIENVQRQNLTPIEEAVSYRKILDMGYMNQSELAEKLGKTQSTIANKLRLLNLTDTVQEALLQERISERHARSLLRLPQDKQDEMLEKIVKNRMTVRKTDEEINKILFGEETESSGNTDDTKVLEVRDEIISKVQPIENEEKKEVEKVKEEKEENTMNNNDFMQQFNIPNTPIVGPNNQQEGPINMGQQNGVPNMNQGVGIQSYAQQPVETPTFVNTMDSMPEPNPMFGANGGMAQPAMGNPFSADMNPSQPFNSMQPDFQMPTPNPVEPVMNPQPFQQMNMQQPMDNGNVSDASMDAPIGGRFFNMFGEDTNVNMNANSSQNLNQAMPEQPQNVNFNPFGTDTMMPQNPSPMSLGTESMNMNYSDPIPMPNVPISPEMNQPVQPQPELMNTVQPFQLNDNQEFTNSSVVELGSMGNNRMEEPTLQPLMEEQGPAITMDMKQVISLIRNCAEQIEKSGYTIDTDELDFDDHYQVVFKINKID